MGGRMDTCIHKHTWNTLHTHTHVHICTSSEVIFGISLLAFKFTSVCVIWGMFYNLCLGFLISRMRSAVAFMARDYGLDTMKECMKQA